MKCLAKEQRRADLVDGRRREYGLLCLEFIDQALGYVMIKEFKWGRDKLMKLYNHERSFLLEQVEYYMPDVMRVDERHRGVRFASDGERLYDAMETAFSAMCGELRLTGMELDLSLFDNYGKYSGVAVITQERIKREREKYMRSEWYYHAGRSAARSYVCGALLHLRFDHGFGAKRLTMAYEGVRRELDWFFRRFFEADERCDREIGGRLKTYRERLERAKVPFEDAKFGLWMEYDGKSEAKPVGAAVDSVGDTPEEYRRVLDEVMAEKRFG